MKRMKSEEMRVTEESDVDEESDSHKGGNPGWADAMQKILQSKKPKRKKTIVLSKAKKLCDVKKEETKESVPFEIEAVKEEIKAEDVEKTEENEEKPTAQLKEKRKDILGIRVKPSLVDRERERTLQKIATK